MRIVIGVLQVLDWAASFATPLTVLVMLGKFLERREGWLRLVLRYAAAWVMCNNVIYFGDYVNILYALPAVFLLIRLGWRCRGGGVADRVHADLYHGVHPGGHHRRALYPVLHSA